jgi:nitrite reductase/ring-hydroxylating ferredoxin subunit
MNLIAKTIDNYNEQKYSEDPTVEVHRTNSIVIGLYTNINNTCHKHRDQLYTRNGKFQHKSNSQKKGTVTSIITIGSSRSLFFKQFRNKTCSDIKNGPKRLYGIGSDKSFQLTHGSLFQLHPEDERDQFRTCLEDQFLSYFKHGAKFRDKNGMSVAIILRSTVHVNQFRADTGKLVCDNQSSESSMKDASDILINTQRANELKMVFCTHIKPKLNC